MATSGHEPAPPDGADEPCDRDRDELGREDAYERSQPDSQPTVSSDPEADDEPANAG
jgi:hypothetical protein